MKKHFSLLVALLALTFCAVACDDNDDNDGNYTVSVENACAYLVPKAGSNNIEMNFDAESASAETIKAATALCIEELNGLPHCKDAFIAEYSCEYALSKGKLSTSGGNPCESVLHDDCWGKLTDDQQNEFNSYTNDYMSKYSGL